MKRIGSIAVWLLVSLSPSLALADDLREIEPYFMLVVDTSMSMEERPLCKCAEHTCLNCLPKCDAPNVNGVPPEEKKNRWAIALEALTGTFNDFECEAIPRNDMTVGIGAYDNDPSAYPYNQPWDCSSGPNKICKYGTTDPRISQQKNGVIDLYGERVRFGLMTFDGMMTYAGADELIEYPDVSKPMSFDVKRSEDIQGLWSYGGYKPVEYPGCKVTYAIDTGVRSAAATEGGMVTLNSCPRPTAVGEQCPKECSACPGTTSSLNTDIQAALLRTRPYGGTPIAGALTDLAYHLRNDLRDDFSACRPRYALLLTDGRPDGDFREQGCACDVSSEEPACKNPAVDHEHRKCPYERPYKIAQELVLGTATEKPLLERLFVVGMSVDDQNVKDELNKIARYGCKTEAECDPDGDKEYALFANNFNSLMKNLTAAVDHSLKPVSRSVPAFTPGQAETRPSVAGATAVVEQYQITTAFEGNTEPGAPWAGKIERRRFTCSGDTLAEQKLSGGEQDLFHETLLLNTRRSLVTAMPNTSYVTELEGQLTSNVAGSSCGTGPCSLIGLDQVHNPAVFGTDSAKMTRILNWMNGANAERATALGDIHHSSPVVSGAPQNDTVDEAYNLFRAKDKISHRPLVVYVNSNEGLLHAFSVEKYKDPTGAQVRTLEGGEELWAFVPPALLNDLKRNLDGHVQLLDATPVVKDVYLDRPVANVTTKVTGDEYHTVLITGTRSAEQSAYVALDVTDPLDPKFLWQLTDPDLGMTYAQAAVAQATFKINTSTVKGGAIAVIPGGAGELGDETTPGCAASTRPQIRNGTATNSPPFQSYPADATLRNGYEIKRDVRCWKDKGRVLFFVDVQTGKVLRKLRNATNDASKPPIFTSPLVSTPAVYASEIGTLASRAFVVDADGVIWRIDLSSTDPNEWSAYPFHDMFWDQGPFSGEVSYEAPLLSTDEEGNLIVLVATGDTNNFIKPDAENRVASLTEFLPTLSGGTKPTGVSYKARLNWELGTATTGGLNLEKSELITGSMALFEGQLFFGSFISRGSADACQSGSGRIHAVDYKAYDSTTTNNSMSYGPKRFEAAAISAGGTSVVNVPASKAVSNLLLMGMRVTQRPACSGTSIVDQTDTYNQTYSVFKKLVKPPLYLVAQASGDAEMVQKHSGSEVGSVELEITKKPTFVRVTSWASSVD